MMHKEKIILFVMVMIFVTGQLSGEIKAAGKLLIPTAKGEYQYDAVITITRAEIGIECALKIFQPFNQFDAPKKAKINVSTGEVEEVQVQIQENKIYIITTDSFCIRYRNIFNRASKVIGFECLFPITIENWALIFTLDNPADIGAVSEALIKVIGELCEVLED